LIDTLVETLSASLNRPQERLSPQQVRILQLVTHGLGNKQVARELGISETTVKAQLRVIYSQLAASSRAEAVAAALRLGIVE
jgi:DNA-binding NarL/FixJ family response regulator